MSYLRSGRAGEHRRSMFYTGNSPSEEWELVDPPKDFAEQKNHPDTHRRASALCCLNHPAFSQGLTLVLSVHSSRGSHVTVAQLVLSLRFLRIGVHV